MAITIFSDGGGEKSSAAACACILEKGKGERLHVVGFLGPATNNEAEITGGLLGFMLVHALGLGEDKPKLRWVCDSEYSLKSATEYIHNWQRNGWKTASKQPVKNQGLWKAYLSLSNGVSVKPEHVAGHAGHVENEACDAACTWMQGSGSMLFADAESIKSISPDEGLGAGWVGVDLRLFLSAMRNEFDQTILDEHVAFFKDHQKKFLELSDTPIPQSKKNDVNVFDAFGVAIKKIHAKARAHAVSDERIGALERDLKALLAKHKF